MSSKRKKLKQRNYLVAIVMRKAVNKHIKRRIMMNDKAQELQDELDYLELIAQVALINKDAADYMQGPMRKLYSFEPSGDLWDVVVWESTVQGTDFWYDIVCNLEDQ